MSVTLTHSNERLTWQQIKDRWPETWVGMTEIKFKNDDNVNVESAVVYATGDKYDVIDCECPSDAPDLVTFTSPEKYSLSNWMLWRA